MTFANRRALVIAFASVLGACSDPAHVAAEGADASATPTCEDGDEAVQRRATACLCCHQEDFGVAGSVDPSGPAVARLVVRAGNGDTADMAPNPFGNFFRRLRLEGPLDVTVYSPAGSTLRMKAPAPHGDCNACHRTGGEALPIHGP